LEQTYNLRGVTPCFLASLWASCWNRPII